MIDKIIISAVLGTVGFNGLFPDTPPPLTPAQLQAKAKQKSISNVCDKGPKSKEVKELCRRWRKHNA